MKVLVTYTCTVETVIDVPEKHTDNIEKFLEMASPTNL
jgi:hypothetical protein